MDRAALARAAAAALAGAIALVVWGMIFWGWLAPPLGMFHTLPHADRVTDLLRGDGMPTGTYFVPWPRDSAEAFREFTAHHERGSFYRLSYVREGVDPNSAGKLALGTLHYATVALLAVLLLRLVCLPRFGQRVGAVFLAGLFGSNFITLADPVWFHMPWDYTRGALLYELVSWLLLGAVTAAILPARRA